MIRLEKEERMTRKKRLENSWKYKRNHYDHLRCARELLQGQVLEQVLLEGNYKAETEEGMGPEGRKGGEPEKELEMDEKKPGPGGWKGRDQFMNKVKRLERARKQRNRIRRDLEEVWTFLEDGMPGLESELKEDENNSNYNFRKRNRRHSGTDETVRLEEELELVRIRIEELQVEIKTGEPDKNHEKSHQ